MGFKTGYTEIEYVEIERPIVWTQQREVINVGYDVNYGRLISQGLYSINGVTYELSYNGQEQVWLIVNADGSKSPVAVETYKYHNGMRNVYYYNFGGVWHQYLNNQFSYTQTPPFYTTGYTAPTTSYYGQVTPNQYTVVTSAAAPSKTVQTNYIKPASASSVVVESSYVAPPAQTVVSNTYYKPVYEAPVAAAAAAVDTVVIESKSTINVSGNSFSSHAAGSSFNPIIKPAVEEPVSEESQVVNKKPTWSLNNIFG